MDVIVIYGMPNIYAVSLVKSLFVESQVRVPENAYFIQWTHL